MIEMELLLDTCILLHSASLNKSCAFDAFWKANFPTLSSEFFLAFVPRSPTALTSSIYIEST
uniref:Uncharacterized protein n=1 Tax=Lepeophtheirus salmonis TaxID=72036 RepID=A0A0K2UW22_LEPSM